MLLRAIERAGFAPGEQVAIALDVAASEFGQGGIYARPRRPRAAFRGNDRPVGWLAGALSDRLDRGPLPRTIRTGSPRSRAQPAGAVRWLPTISPLPMLYGCVPRRS